MTHAMVRQVKVTWHAGQDGLHDTVFESLTESLLDSCVACRTR